MLINEKVMSRVGNIWAHVGSVHDDLWIGHIVIKIDSNMHIIIRL